MSVSPWKLVQYSVLCLTLKSTTTFLLQERHHRLQAIVTDGLLWPLTKAVCYQQQAAEVAFLATLTNNEQTWRPVRRRVIAHRLPPDVTVCVCGFGLCGSGKRIKSLSWARWKLRNSLRKCAENVLEKSYGKNLQKIFTWKICQKIHIHHFVIRGVRFIFRHFDNS